MIKLLGTSFSDEGSSFNDKLIFVLALLLLHATRAARPLPDGGTATGRERVRAAGPHARLRGERACGGPGNFFHIVRLLGGRAEKWIFFPSIFSFFNFFVLSKFYVVFVLS